MASNKLIDWTGPVLSDVLDLLLRDMATGRNVKFMTDAYFDAVDPETGAGDEFSADSEITAGKIRRLGIRPRIEKCAAEQKARTKTRAEVFTPAWLVNEMLNKLDEEWFNRSPVFNVEKDHDWEGIGQTVGFQGASGTWQDYIRKTYLEITCGEAPFITRRYDAATGVKGDIGRRIGALDRKLKIAMQQCRGNDEETVKWAFEALKSCYGYEYQGDSLVIARANVLLTVYEHLKERAHIVLSREQLEEACGIVCWNFWQMDGLENTVPGSVKRCIVMDWEKGRPAYFDDGTLPDGAASLIPGTAGTGYFDAEDGPESEPDAEFEPIGRELFVASSVGLLASSIGKSTLRDDTYGRGEKLARQMALQYYSTAQGFQAILDKLETGDGPSTPAAGFIGLVDRIAVKGRVTGAMKSSLVSFRNEAFDPMMKLCRDAVELLLRAALYHQRYEDMDALDSHDLRLLARRCEWDGLPGGLDERIHGFVSELAEHDADLFLDSSLERKGADLGVVIRDTGRLFGICNKYIFGN